MKVEDQQIDQSLAQGSWERRTPQFHQKKKDSDTKNYGWPVLGWLASHGWFGGGQGWSFNFFRFNF
jgi:hypothetical protein